MPPPQPPIGIGKIGRICNRGRGRSTKLDCPKFRMPFPRFGAPIPRRGRRGSTANQQVPHPEKRWPGDGEGAAVVCCVGPGSVPHWPGCRRRQSKSYDSCRIPWQNRASRFPSRLSALIFALPSRHGISTTQPPASHIPLRPPRQPWDMEGKQDCRDKKKKKAVALGLALRPLHGVALKQAHRRSIALGHDSGTWEPLHIVGLHSACLGISCISTAPLEDTRVDTYSDAHILLSGVISQEPTAAVLRTHVRTSLCIVSRYSTSSSRGR